MIFFFYCLLFISGYGVGFLLRRLFTYFKWGNTTCNIQKRGIGFRLFLSIIVLVASFYFQLPILIVFSGFIFYESRARWCIVRNFQ